ncbi:MAG: hypothetical protein M1832_001921 [Thelocarpon impressellum]|nr:MAG: hypothetical protein M1832_001921 [Thelocarpon impressellum]
MAESRLDQVVKGAPAPGATLSPSSRPSTAGSAATTPDHEPDDPMASLPSSPPQIYLNLLILEASLRSQYLTLRARRRQHTFFLMILTAWIGYFFYALFMRPREDGKGLGGSVYWVVEMAEKVALMGGVVTAMLIWGTGQWERGVRWPRRWVGIANRGLRNVNSKLIVVKGPWWRELLSAISFLFPYSSLFPAAESSFQYVDHIPETGRRPRHGWDDRETVTVEEDLSPGGDYVKLLLLPKPFSPDFRENWELFRTEYWEKENERRLELRQRLRRKQQEIAKKEGGWLWWTGWQNWRRTKAWSFRVPSPPRIVVPPPILSGAGDDGLTLRPHPSPSFSASDSATLGFLDQVTYGDFCAANGMLDWRYESRREAQKILPFVYLGPVGAARDKGFLRREGITMLLAIRNTRSAQARLLDGSRIAVELGIRSDAVDVAGNQELIAAFPAAIQLVNAHMSNVYGHQMGSLADDIVGKSKSKASMGKVLVYCESGNERSAAVVAAYMMAMYDMDVVKVIQIIQAQRFCSAFDDALKDLLRTFADIISAKRNVMLSVHESATVRGGEGPASSDGNAAKVEKRSKRKLDEAYDAEMDVDDGSGEIDDGRFDGREGFAPFQDTALL